MTKHLTDSKDAPVTTQIQAEARIAEQLPIALSRDAVHEETTVQNVPPAPEAGAVTRERRRGDALARQLAVLQLELEVAKRQAAIELQEAAETAQVHAAELSKAQADERQRAEALARELAAARQELEDTRAQMLALQRDQQNAVAVALQEEQRKSAKLTQSLAAAQRELKAAKQQGGGAARQSAETASAQVAEEGDASTPEVAAVRSAPEAATRPRTKARQRGTGAGEDFRAVGLSGARAAPSRSAVSRQQPITPQQFEWE